MIVKKLPTFKKYTVDVKLQQFRKIKKQSVQVIPFHSIKGEALLVKYLNSLNPNSKKFKEFIKHFKS